MKMKSLQLHKESISSFFIKTSFLICISLFFVLNESKAVGMTVQGDTNVIQYVPETYVVSTWAAISKYEVDCANYVWSIYKNGNLVTTKSTKGVKKFTYTFYETGTYTLRAFATECGFPHDDQTVSLHITVADNPIPTAPIVTTTSGICPSGTSTYGVKSLGSDVLYTWECPPGFTINGLQKYTSTSTAVTVQAPAIAYGNGTYYFYVYTSKGSNVSGKTPLGVNYGTPSVPVVSSMTSNNGSVSATLVTPGSAGYYRWLIDGKEAGNGYSTSFSGYVSTCSGHVLRIEASNKCGAVLSNPYTFSSPCKTTLDDNEPESTDLNVSKEEALIYQDGFDNNYVVKGIEEGAKVMVINTTGQVVHDGNVKGGMINMPSLNSGMYIINVYNNGEVVSKKIIKE